MDIYCPVCSGCGEEGCCSAVHCGEHEDGKYCGAYLMDLKFGYLMYRDVFELIPEDKQDEFDKIWNENYELIYKQEEEE